jgi:hypothetical protein
MTDREVFELKKGDTVYVADLRSVGGFNAKQYIAVLFECIVTCVRKDGTLKVKAVKRSTRGAEIDEPYMTATFECYPDARCFERSPYAAMAKLHNSVLGEVKKLRGRLAQTEANLAGIIMDPLLAFGFNENQILAEAMDIPRERECVKCENMLPVCCDTEDGPYCTNCCPCDHRKGGGDFQRTDVEV